MKVVFQKIMASALCILVLLSTVSWKVEKHYCMGHLVDVALFSKVDSCGMNMSMDAIDEKESSCCDDEVILVQGQENLQMVSLEDLNLEQQTFFLAFANSYMHIFRWTNEKLVPNEHYPPPLLVKDIQLLDDVFLI